MQLISDLLIAEYQTLVAELPNHPSHKQIIQSLIQNADWTPQAAQDLLHLATTRGTFMLRNALALANALQIEDGTAGF